MQTNLKSTKNLTAKEVLSLHTKGKIFNDPDYYVRLAEIYEKGAIVEKDLKKAVEYYKRAVNIGSAKAAEALANFYEFGAGKRKLGRHSKKIAKWWLKAAELGSPEGMLRTAINFQYGLGLPVDEQKASEWYSALSASGVYTGTFSIADSKLMQNCSKGNIRMVNG